MLNEQVIEKVIERLVSRIEEANTYTLKKIGESIKKIGTLSPNDANKLGQIIRYGADYNKIVNKIAEITRLNVNDIYDIFEEVTKRDYKYAKQFYDYRNVKYIPYEENIVLQRQVRAIAKITAEQYVNLSNTLAFSKKVNGKIVYSDISRVYQDAIDKAILSVSQGKSTFNEEMYSTIKELASSGLKTVKYGDNRGMRLDSAVRMNMQEGLRTLHNANQELFGEEFGYNGVEVTHHQNAAPDHINTVDGKQFILVDKVQEQINSGIEKEIKQEDIRGNQVKVKGKWYDDFNAVNNSLQRKVSTLNCRHTIFSIIVGVSKPEYTQEQLDEDKKSNIDGFMFEGRHYSLYDGEQLLRKIELELRKAKDEQIMGRASGIVENIDNAQKRITVLTNKYRDILKASGLKSKLERARVSQYKRVAKSKLK